MKADKVFSESMLLFFPHIAVSSDECKGLTDFNDTYQAIDSSFVRSVCVPAYKYT